MNVKQLNATETDNLRLKFLTFQPPPVSLLWPQRQFKTQVQKNSSVLGAKSFLTSAERGCLAVS